MLPLFKKHLQDQLPFLLEKKLLLAISGGLDSVVLAVLCHRLKLNFALAHCNFKLRGSESDQDQQFVEALAKRLKLEVYTKSFETEEEAKRLKFSTQMTARKLRYDWFEALADEHGFEHILTAHHADDQLETFLINLSRGTGIEGLMGIPTINDKVVRPLLPFSRAELAAYAHEEGLNWREDSSNAETKYLRNKLRHALIPQLKELNPQFLSNFISTTHYLSGSHALAQKHIKELEVVLFNKKGDTYQIPVNYLKQLQPQSAYLYAFFHDYGFTEWNDVKDLLDAQSGKQLFSSTHRLLKDREHLYLQALSDAAEVTSFSIAKGTKLLQRPLSITFTTLTGDRQNAAYTAYIDKEKLKYPLTVRKWKNGDYFYPLGMQGKKKLSEFFRDEKYSLIDKEQQWLLCSDEKIVWVIGKRLDDRFKVTKRTKAIVEVKLI